MSASVVGKKAIFGSRHLYSRISVIFISQLSHFLTGPVCKSGLRLPGLFGLPCSFVGMISTVNQFFVRYFDLLQYFQTLLRNLLICSAIFCWAFTISLSIPVAFVLDIMVTSFTAFFKFNCLSSSDLICYQGLFMLVSKIQLYACKSKFRGLEVTCSKQLVTLLNFVYLRLTVCNLRCTFVRGEFSLHQ